MDMDVCRGADKRGTIIRGEDCIARWLTKIVDEGGVCFERVACALEGAAYNEIDRSIDTVTFFVERDGA